METKGDLFTGKVKDLSSSGEGVVEHSDGRVFFVKGVFPGDAGHFEIVRTKKRYGFAKVIELIESSSDRVPLSCVHQGFGEGQCGACDWMGVSYEAQLKYKHQLVAQQLAHHKVDGEVLSVQPSAKHLEYRNRASLKAKGSDLGYVQPASHRFVPVNHCPVLNEKTQFHFQQAKERLKEKPVPEQLTVHLDELHGVSWKKPHLFRQANNEQNAWMKGWLRSQIGSRSVEEEVLELFCGSGNFTEVLLEHFQTHVTAVDVAGTEKLPTDSSQLRALDLNLFDSKTWKRFLGPSFRTLVLDPPREGFVPLSDLVRALPSLEQIIYISCEPKSYARDVSSLQELGWRPQVVQPLDQFPQTSHVEILSVLGKSVDNPD